MTLSSALSLVCKASPRFLVVETFGLRCVLGVQWDGSVQVPDGSVANGEVFAFGGVEV